jgi:hypothetical protein
MSWQELFEYETQVKNFQELIKTRVYFVSKNVLSQPQVISENTLMYLRTRFDYQMVLSDHYVIFFLKNFTDLPENYLIPRQKKPVKPKIIPDAIPINLDF